MYSFSRHVDTCYFITSNLFVQVMDLKENELHSLADHMGYDMAVHRKFYRLPSTTVEVAKIGKLLMFPRLKDSTNLVTKSLMI